MREGEQRSIPKSLADGLTQIGKVAGAIRPIRPTHAFVGLRLLPPDRIARQVRPIHVGKALKAQGPLGLSSRVLGGTEPLDYKFQEARGTDDLAPVVDAEKLADFASNEVLGHVIHPAFFYDRFPIGAESFEAVSQAGGTEEPPGWSAQSGSV